jgi:hypothetical protein
LHTFVVDRKAILMLAQHAFAVIKANIYDKEYFFFVAEHLFLKEPYNSSFTCLKIVLNFMLELSSNLY